MIAAVVFVGLFGALIGSFLNVVVYRVPLGMSIVSPPSACPNCGTEIKGYDNIPVVSWLLLKGKCRSCGNRISARYPLVELGTAVAFAVVAAAFVPSVLAADSGAAVAGAILLLVAYLYLAAISVALTLIDLDTHTLPNSIVFPSYVVAAVLLAAGGLLAGDLESVIRAGVGFLIVGGLYLVLHLISPRGMGGGDVKLAGVLGLYLGYLGWGELLVGVLSAFILGGLFGVGLIVLRKAQRRSGIPFGPWMLLGAWIGILAGEWIWTSYLSLFGLGVAS